MRIKENYFRKKLRDALHREGWLTEIVEHKFKSGFPDLILVPPGGHVCFAELKSRRKKEIERGGCLPDSYLTPIQVTYCRSLAMHKTCVFVIIVVENTEVHVCRILGSKDNSAPYDWKIYPYREFFDNLTSILTP